LSHHRQAKSAAAHEDKVVEIHELAKGVRCTDSENVSVQLFSLHQGGFSLADQNQPLKTEPSAEVSSDTPDTATDARKEKFVEPEISAAVDVLEATTFFQASGTGPIP
jgi:hypothetical protein